MVTKAQFADEAAVSQRTLIGPAGVVKNGGPKTEDEPCRGGRTLYANRCTPRDTPVTARKTKGNLVGKAIHAFGHTTSTHQ